MEDTTIIKEEEKKSFNWLEDMDVGIEAVMNGGVSVRISGESLTDKVNTVCYSIAMLTATIYRDILPEDMHLYTDRFQHAVISGIQLAAAEKQLRDERIKEHMKTPNDNGESDADRLSELQ